MPKRIRSTREDAPNHTEVDQLLKACLDTLDNLMIPSPLFAGLRIGEVQQALKTWVDWDKGIVPLPARQLCRGYECRKWRNGIWTPNIRVGVRSAIITEDSEPWLCEFFGVNEAIGRNRQALEQRVERITHRSRLLKPEYPHCLRATFATQLEEQGMSAPSLAYLIGWEGLQVAEACIQSSMRRAHEEMRELALVR